MVASATDAGIRALMASIAHPDAKILQPHLETIADEVNVKSVDLVDDVEQFGVREVKVNSKIGARLGGQDEECSSRSAEERVDAAARRPGPSMHRSHGRVSNRCWDSRTDGFRKAAHLMSRIIACSAVTTQSCAITVSWGRRNSL
jgi:hypothetical protein